MNPSTFVLWFLLASFGLSSNGSAGEREEFDALLSGSSKPWGLDRRLEGEWRKWSGLGTAGGVELAVEYLLSSDDLARRQLSYYILENTVVTKADVVQHVISQCEAASKSGAMSQLERGFRLLLKVEGDSTVVAFLAKHFGDDRMIETRPRPSEAYYGEPRRVSDTACGVAKGWLQQQGLWDTADPDCHEDPGGFMMWEGRDNTKEAINRFLLKKGLIEKAEQPLRRKWEHDYSTATAPAPAKLDPARPRKDPQLLPPPAPAEESIPFYWPWLAAALVLLGWSVIRYLRRRSTG